MFADENTILLLLPELFLVLLATWICVGGTFSASQERWSVFLIPIFFSRQTWWSVFATAVYLVVGYNLYRQDSALVEQLVYTSGNQFTAGPLVIDVLGQSCRWMALLVGLLFTLTTFRLAERQVAPEYLATLMLLITGVMIAGRANDLVLLFLGLELVSIPTYVLLFLGRRSRVAAESTAKYFFLSILSSALLLYGFSFLYGMAGTTAIIGSGEVAGLNDVMRDLATKEATVDTGLSSLMPFALVLIFAGLGFKLAVVPFHFYAPDVYQGTTNANAGLLAVAPKIVGVLAFVRLTVAFLPLAVPFAWQLAVVLSVLTMTVGNVCALWQKNVRRLMAFSSIAHGGYLLIGLSAAVAGFDYGATDNGGIAAMWFYLVVYVVASIGAFAAFAYLSNEEGELDRVEQLAGLASQQPLLAAAIAVFMFSLAGIPPLAGFWGKLSLFSSAIVTAQGIESAEVSPWLIILAVVAGINAAIAAAYYLRIVATMYFFRPRAEAAGKPSWGVGAAVAICAAVVLAIGFFPKLVLENARRAEQATLAESQQASDADARKAIIAKTR